MNRVGLLVLVITRKTEHNGETWGVSMGEGRVEYLGLMLVDVRTLRLRDGASLISLWEGEWPRLRL